MFNVPLELIRFALKEDMADADVTTLCTVPIEKQTLAHIIARQQGVIAGLAIAAATFKEFDQQIKVEMLVNDGEVVQLGQMVAHISGPARSVLSAERVALNFLGHLSGIATLTSQCVRALEGTKARILDTRKTTPGLRSLEKEAVRLGGGKNHRLNLSDGVLIKDNHIKATGDITQAIKLARFLAPHLLKIEVECETLLEVQQALEAETDVLLLDNMAIEVMRSAVDLVRSTSSKVLIEASGSIGTKADTLAAVAATGVDFISLGAITHSAPQFDVSLEFDSSC